MARKIIKDTKYCQIFSQGKISDEEYTYCIEKIFVKAKEREEIRFSLYKDTIVSHQRYIPRSLDVTEEELLELMKQAIDNSVFSKEFIKNLSEQLNQRQPKKKSKEELKDVKQN
ncbi:MAG: hypothetical protein LKF87_13865 [Clostridium tyrobutyricum]|jgi:hypothetical protein|uniref:hypothetical protein n=1 Tax=Clostridium tyrobutyricum TaxID=1519 RepID=UPI002431D65D|nr:hypothetical protein [Clostridium tyrobutyricum]MCH4198729.1 hypothetical protein [Clostridium tyrobutyricum]MCH4260004.1 hypothetical protein [Clostridium tyrobutyricum]MCI1239656.1 hypothetical protein [Clostridium tyrobutyricum]MCI1652389.1 hypothetical protein [Clostridium tyrobutyricum]MCI1938098.1 hypothetical protein [Clostridium tyrobutyricum]